MFQFKGINGFTSELLQNNPNEVDFIIKYIVDQIFF